MKKNYIKQMFALLLVTLFAGQVNAQEVKFDFNSMTNLSMSWGETKQDGVVVEEASSAGDITEEWTETIDGVTIAVSPKEESSKNPNRFWRVKDSEGNYMPQLRCYSGTITISASENIASVEFAVNGSNFNLEPNVGGISNKTWGGKATEIVFTIKGNTQLNSITVTLGDNGQEPETVTGGTLEDPFTASKALELLASNNIPSGSVYVQGKIASISNIDTGEFGNAEFYITDDGNASTTTTDMLLAYRLKYLNNEKFTEECLNQGDDVILYGQLTNYTKDGVTIPEIKSGYIYSHNGNTGSTTPDDPNPGEVTNLDGFTNGDFEAWTDGLPDHWNSGNAVSSATLEQSSDAHGGSYAVSITAKSTNTRLAYEPMNLEAGTYQVSFYAKAESEEAIARAGYADEKADGSGFNYNYPNDAVTVKADNWEQITCEFTLEEAKTVYLMVMCNKNSTGNLLIDDYTIGKKDGGDTPQPADIPVAGNIERLKTMEANQEVKLILEDALVLYISGKEMFVRDASSAICFYGMSDNFKAGDLLNGSIIAKYTVYKGMPELTAQGSTNFSVEDVAVTANNTPQPATMTLDEIAAYECDYVVVNNMVIEKQKDGTLLGYTDDAEAIVYDKFNLNFTYEEGKAYNVTGIVIPFIKSEEEGLIYQLCPTEEFSGIEKEKATFVKTNTVEANKRYLLVAEVENEDGSKTLKVAKPVSGNYGYLYVNDFEVKNTLTNIETENALTIEADATSSYYRIKQSDDRYYWMDESHNSFQVEAAPNEGFYWDIQANGDGTFTITNVDRQKYIQFSITHNSYGSYPEAQENAVMPMLYVEGESDATAINEVAVENQNAAIYNMAGQRVSNAVKGVFIQNGKKYIVK
ncbi:MAG: carbohydrate binding domain-containing protein [Prevotella sp.]|nr:carbohydrate binding domain-containing protein [Prevotella sp.]